ncbi:serine hydrolase domain-containing protein [Maricaulis parjimensis]|uniref:serine hydrolase domain-containing protein n=1 Tax=Maricaulis parjimensis TaxID=144023 RepID=UPI001939D7FF|nr:serine hydrolase domain-containing protein [Maricaulis parjimensis]
MLIRSLAAAALLTSVSPLPVLAQDMHPVEDPRALGFDPAGLDAIDARIEDLSAAHARPGYAVIITRGEQVAYVAEAGTANFETGEAFTIDTPVRIASMTKPVTAVAIMQLVEDGLVQLDAPVSQYLPAFADVQVALSPMAGPDGVIATRAPDTEMTVEHLLTHTAGLGYLFEAETDLGQLYLDNSLYDGEGDLMARMEQLADLPLYTDPGETWIYSYSIDVLGAIVQAASGMPFEDYLETEIFTPLGMDSTGFFFDDVDFTEDELAPLYVHDEAGELVLVPESPFPDWPSGGGGLVSTATDYAQFAMMLANGGTLGDVQILQPDTAALMMSPHTTPEQLGERWEARRFAYAGDVVIPPADGETARGIPGDYSWGGLFDTDFFVSPATRVAVITTTQIQPGPHRPEPRTSAQIRPLAYQAMAFD